MLTSISNWQTFIMFLDQPYCYLGAFIIAIALKIGLLFYLNNSNNDRIDKRGYRALLVILLAGIFVDASWICRVLVTVWQLIPLTIAVNIYRAAWLAFFWQYQSLGYLIERLTNNENAFRWWHRFNVFLVTLISLYLLVCIAFFTQVISYSERLFELKILGYSGIYLYIAIAINLAITLWRLCAWHNLPRILKQQLTLFMVPFVLPYLILEFVQQDPLDLVSGAVTQSILISSISTLVLSFALAFVCRKLFAMRFLNVSGTILNTQPPHTRALNKAVENLALAKDPAALTVCTQQFFVDQFGIQADQVSLWILHHTNLEQHTKIETIQRHLNTDPLVMQFLIDRKIITRYDLEFDAFTNQTGVTSQLVDIMVSTGITILLPIIDGTTLLGLIMVYEREHEARLYGEQDQQLMVLFTRYASSFVHLLELTQLQHHKRAYQQLVHTLYEQQHTVRTMQESMRFFINNSRSHAIGLLLYKNRTFVIANQAARDLLPININVNAGHPIAKTIKSITRDSISYRKEQRAIIEHAGSKLICTAVPLVEGNQIVIAIYPLDMTDAIQYQAPFLSHASDWQYLLYLETTEMGKLIAQLLPATSPVCTAWKVAIAQAACSLRPLLLQAPQQDCATLVPLIHHCGMRTGLQHFHLTQALDHHEFVIAFAGINPLFGNTVQQPLLQAANQGTLWIENLEFIDHSSQQYLVDFVTTGTALPFRSTESLQVQVRLIFTTQQPLQQLWQTGIIIEPLYQLLLQQTVTIPSLQTVADQELQQLATMIARQQLPDDAPQQENPLSTQELVRLLQHKPTSIGQLRQEVTQVMKKKYKSLVVSHHEQSNPKLQDPELISMAKLGKEALKDKIVMARLWQEFKNQNKIASFLGVNRSSVNRRCKEFNLG